MFKESTKATWEAPKLAQLDVSETRDGIPADYPEGTVFSNPAFGDVEIGNQLS